MKVLKTNWINFAGSLIVSIVYAICVNSGDIGASSGLLEALLRIFTLILTLLVYGAIFYLFLFATLVITDLLFIRNASNLKMKLLLQWLIISAPFIYWLVVNKEWIFLVNVSAFLVTQLLREKLIMKAII